MQIIQNACLAAGIITELSGRNDILANDRKFSGNAFYNSRDKAYHHGTILVCSDLDKAEKYLTPSKAKLESKGVRSVRSRIINLCEISQSLSIDKMKQYLIDAFEQEYSLTAKHIAVADKELQALFEQYSDWDYLYGTPFAFTFSCKDRFSWGQIELQLEIKNGKITESRTFTDSMDQNLADTVNNAINNCKFEKSTVAAALRSYLDKRQAEEIAKLLFN